MGYARHVDQGPLRQPAHFLDAQIKAGLALLCLLAGCGESCSRISENGRAMVWRCGQVMHVKVGDETVFVGDEVVKAEWISETRLRVTYPMDSRVHSRESRVPGLRVEYEAVAR